MKCRYMVACEGNVQQVPEMLAVALTGWRRQGLPGTWAVQSPAALPHRPVQRQVAELRLSTPKAGGWFLPRDSAYINGLAFSSKWESLLLHTIYSIICLRGCRRYLF